MSYQCLVTIVSYYFNIPTFLTKTDSRIYETCCCSTILVTIETLLVNATIVEGFEKPTVSTYRTTIKTTISLLELPTDLWNDHLSLEHLPLYLWICNQTTGITTTNIIALEL